MKRIAYIIPSLDEGGMPRVLETLSNGLDAEYEQYVIVLIKNKSKNFDIKGEIIPILDGGKGVVGKIITFIGRIRKIKSIKKTYNFDAVISFGVVSNFLNCITKHKENVILTEHNVKSIEHRMWGGYGKICDAMLKLSYGHAKKIITVSSYVKQDLIKEYNINPNIIDVVYNGIDKEFIGEKAKANIDTKFMDNKINLVSVSRLSKQKGLCHIVRILPLLVKKYPNVQYVIVGEGEEREKLEKIIRKLNLNLHVCWVGETKNPFPYVKKADIFLFPSIYEGFGLSLLEAMALKIPVISTDCKSGPREIIAERDDYDNCINEAVYMQYGVLVPVIDDVENEFENHVSEKEMNFLEAIEFLLDNKSVMKEYSRQGEYRSNKFSNENMIRNYKKIIDTL